MDSDMAVSTRRSKPKSGIADRDRAWLGAGAAGFELGEIGFAVRQPLEAGQRIADRVELADQQPLRGAVLAGRPVRVDDDHPPVILQRRTHVPEKLRWPFDL